MLHMRRSLVLALLAGSLAPVAASAAPLGKMIHMHPRGSHSHDGRVTVFLVNKNDMFRDVQVGGKTYTVLAHESVSITAQSGTQIVAAGPASNARGNIVATIEPSLNSRLIYLN